MRMKLGPGQIFTVNLFSSSVSNRGREARMAMLELLISREPIVWLMMPTLSQVAGTKAFHLSALLPSANLYNRVCKIKVRLKKPKMLWAATYSS